MRGERPVLILGLDGATWTILDRWIADGTLPNLGRLRARGAWGPLASTIPPLTPPAWASFLTGKNPGRHGVFHFAQIDARTSDIAAGTPSIVDARSIESPTLWDVLGHAGRRIVTINTPMSYPPRPVNGVMVTCLLTPPDAAAFTWPVELTPFLRDGGYRIDLDRFIDEKPFARDEQGDKPKRVVEPSVELVDEFAAMEETRAQTALDLMRTEAWDVFTVVFTAPDRMGHYMWSYHLPEDLDGSPEAAAIQAAIQAFYRRLDGQLGELIEEAGPDATVVVLSDHGMGPTFRRHVHWNDWLHGRGLVAVAGGSGGSPDAWLLRLRLPRDRIGRLVRRIPFLRRSGVVERARRARTATIDLDRSQAYYVRLFDPVGGIRVNARGAEREALIERLLAEVRTAPDPATGRPVVTRAGRREEFVDGPFADRLPDIILVMDERLGSSDRLSSYSALVTDRPTIGDPGTHWIDGVFVAAGPEIATRAEPLEGATIVDVAPTVLHLAGVPVPEGMDGRVISDALTPAAAARPVERSPDGERWPSDAEATFVVAGQTAEDGDQVRERLRALGYVE
jgi:predicted AlkP superfamily phosphohydrolase/phosphomutase